MMMPCFAEVEIFHAAIALIEAADAVDIAADDAMPLRAR